MYIKSNSFFGYSLKRSYFCRSIKLLYLYIK